MAYSICKIKNLTGEISTLNGHQFQVNEVYIIQDSIRLSWANSDTVLSSIADESFEIHDSIGAISGISKQIDWLKDHAPITIEHTSEYSMKCIGISASCSIDTTTNITKKIENQTGESYTYKYLWGGELFGDNIEYGDYARFSITDEDNILGYGSGFEVKSFIEKAYCKPAPCPNHFMAEAPAKIPVGLYLKCEYSAINAGSSRDIFINFNIHNKG